MPEMTDTAPRGMTLEQKADWRESISWGFATAAAVAFGLGLAGGPDRLFYWSAFAMFMFANTRWQATALRWQYTLAQWRDTLEILTHVNALAQDLHLENEQLKLKVASLEPDDTEWRHVGDS